jgi:hypothetical protein
MTRKKPKFDDERHQGQKDEGGSSNDNSVFGSSGRKVGPGTTDKRRGRGLGRRLDKLDRELAERRAGVGATGEPVVDSAISTVPISVRASHGKIKQCCLCLAPAQYSFAYLVSVLGTNPRVQKCSHVVLLCEPCIHELCHTPTLTSLEVLDELKRAYTSIIRQAPALTTGKAL